MSGRNRFIGYACIMIAAMAYLVINHFIVGDTNGYFIMLLVLVGFAGLYRKYVKRVAQ